jgi:1,2-dihydroxy-3-keto-5-methylthiopentene dioxygenase
MTLLVRAPDDDAARVELRTTDADVIRAALAPFGVRFERWTASVELPPGADQAAILAAYADDVARLSREGGYRSADVVRLVPDDSDPAWPAKAAGARAKFLAEHTHAEDEVRFFVEGSGVFYLRLGAEIFALRCERGDLLSVPAGTRHWFDMGTRPAFCAIRLFGNPDGWIAAFTGDDIATRFPTADELSA